MLAWLRETTADTGQGAVIQVAVSFGPVAVAIVAARWHPTGLGADPWVTVGRGLAQVLWTGLILAGASPVRAAFLQSVVALGCVTATNQHHGDHRTGQPLKRPRTVVAVVG